MVKNIKIAYIISFFYNSFFWLGTWVMYYLLFTDYAGIGLIESVALISSSLSEIPTGAIADLLGKRKTLILAFLVAGLAEIAMGSASQFNHLLISVIFIAIGHSLYSGTIEALIFDSLKENKQEGEYKKVLSNINSISYIASAIASIFGGYIFLTHPRSPNLLVGSFYILGSILSFFLKEPSIDTEKFSLSNYIIQTKQGFKQLFKTQDIKKQSLFLLTTGFFTIIAYESLIDLLAVDLGFASNQLGILFTVSFLSSALFSQFTSKLTVKFGNNKSLYLINIAIAILFIVSPALNLVFGAIMILLWFGLNAIHSNIDSDIVNQNTTSKYRATTISTLKMLKQTPYVIFAYYIGVLMDIMSVKNIASIFGLILLVVTIVFYPSKSTS